MFFEGESLYVSKSIIRIFLRSFGLCCVCVTDKNLV